MVSRSFFEARVRRPSRGAVLLCLLWVTVAVGCVTVRPEERELLADPAMTFGSDSQIQAHDDHVFSNREGSFGAGSVSGGGCGCN